MDNKQRMKELLKEHKYTMMSVKCFVVVLILSFFLRLNLIEFAIMLTVLEGILIYTNDFKKIK